MECWLLADTKSMRRRVASGEAQRGKASRAPGRTAAASRISYYSGGTGISRVFFSLFSPLYRVHAYRYIHSADLYDTPCVYVVKLDMNLTLQVPR